MKQKILFLIIAGVLTWPARLFTQGLNQVAIFGYVTNSSTGQPVSGVIVEAISEADSTQRSSAISDVQGRYQMNLVTDVPSTPGSVPAKFQLFQNYPNPFNPSTVIGFHVPRSSDVRLVIYNTLGQKVKTLADQTFSPGEYTVVWDATDDAGRGVAAGVYFYQLRTEDDFIQTRKMALLDGSVGGYSSFSPSISLSKNQQNYMAKSAELMVTIRASGARIVTQEWRQVMIPTQNFRFDIGVSVTIESVINKDLVVVSEPSAEGKIYVSGLVDAVIDTVVGTEKVTVINHRTREEVAMRVNYDGSFPQMSLDATVGDSLSLTLFSEGQQVGESEGLSVQSMRPPVVTKTKPTNGDKDIVVDLLVFIHFSEPMDAVTINESSFMLTDNTGKMSGSIGFLNDNTVATFKPDQSLEFGNNYTITVTTDVTDLRGMPLNSTFTSTFTTGDTLISGGQIAFTRLEFSTGEQGLYVIDNDGENLERLTKQNDVYDGYADWSPDGTKIVFSRHFEDGHSEIYLMNSDGTFLENLTDDSTVQNRDPDFSPDGNRITFTTNRDGNKEIYRMNINGTNVVNLTDTPDLEEAFPDWSPDGSKIVYVVNHSLNVKDLLVMQNDGTNKQTLMANVPYLFPAWSPDGTEIAFASIRGNGLDERIFIMSADGTNLREITVGASLGGPSWAPDGRALTFIRQDENYWPAVAVINRDASNLKVLTPETQDGNFDIWVEGPAWSPWPIRN